MYAVGFASVVKFTNEPVAGAMVEERYTCRPSRSFAFAIANNQAHKKRETLSQYSFFDDAGRIFYRSRNRSILLGLQRDFSSRRDKVKQKKLQEVMVGGAEMACSEQLVTQLTDDKKRSLVILPRHYIMEEHPYLTGSGDHVNSQHQSTLYFQFGVLFSRQVHGVATQDLVAAHIHFLSFVEFDLPLELCAQHWSLVDTTERFEDVEPGEPSADTGSRHVRLEACLRQANKCCSTAVIYLSLSSLSHL